jgi:pimeloyl-ACP methyl ester carboxylesterase
MTTTTFILVPGAGGDPLYWHHVLPLLRDAGHEAVAVRLPAGEDGAGLAEYAAVIKGVIGDRSRVVLVAQSMGAFSAPLAAAAAPPGRVARIALVAPMIPAPGESASEFGAATGQEAAARAYAIAEGRDPDAPFDLHEMFLHDVPEDVANHLLEEGDTREEVRSFEDPWPLDAWPDIPTTVIAGARDRLFPLGWMRDLARERLGVRDVTVIDSGHLPALSRPGDLVRTILESASPFTSERVPARQTGFRVDRSAGRLGS